jgi:hypothetical protein
MGWTIDVGFWRVGLGILINDKAMWKRRVPDGATAFGDRGDPNSDQYAAAIGSIDHFALVCELDSLVLAASIIANTI